MEEGTQLIDVRSPQEHAQDALPGSVNYPLQTLRAGVHKIDVEKPVYAQQAGCLRITQVGHPLRA